MKKTLLFLTIFTMITSCENNEISSIEKTLVIASQKVNCVGLITQKCLLVKESNSQNWTYFYDNIFGFNYEEGFEYVIIVSEKEIDNPPQDASSIKTSLVKIISKVIKNSENLPQ